MFLINATNWQTRDLKKFLIRCLKYRGVVYQSYTVAFRNHMLWCIGGYAQIGKPCFTILLPAYLDGEMDRRDLAQTIIHELDHTLGLEHIDMIEPSCLDIPRVDDLKIRVKKCR